VKFGIAPLLGGRYKKVVVDNHPEDFGISVFTKVEGGGDGLQVVKEVLAKRKRIPFAELNFCWDDSHSYGSKHYTYVKSEAIRAKSTIQKYPNVMFYCIPVTEHGLKESDWRKFEAIVKKEIGSLPNVKIVNSPIKTGKFSGVINVYHHQKGGDAFNYDGANCFDSDVQGDKDSYANGEYFLFWCPQCNGNRKVFKAGDKRGPLDHIKRKDRVFWPVKEHYLSMIALVKSKGATESFTKGLIVKSHSDQHTPKPSGKDCKPVYITPLNVKPERLELKLNGKVVSTSSVKAPYNEKKSDGSNGKQVGWRYYFPKWGYQIANAVCELRGGGKLLAKVNPAFRCFSYR
jgi:hypothetical protein